MLNLLKTRCLNISLLRLVLKQEKFSGFGNSRRFLSKLELYASTPFAKTKDVANFRDDVINIYGNIDFIENRFVVRDELGCIDLIPSCNDDEIKMHGLDLKRKFFVTGKVDRQNVNTPDGSDKYFLRIYSVLNELGNFVAGKKEEHHAVWRNQYFPSGLHENCPTVMEANKFPFPLNGVAFNTLSQKMITKKVADAVMVGEVKEVLENRIVVYDGFGNFVAVKNHEMNKDIFNDICRIGRFVKIIGYIQPTIPGHYDTKLTVENLCLKATTILSVSEAELISNYQPLGLNAPDLANKYTYRTHTCGELRSNHVGQKVSIAGWVRNFRMGTFLVVFDAYGWVQLVPSHDDPDMFKKVGNLSLDSVVTATGFVCLRPLAARKPELPTGDVEIVVDNIEVINYNKSSSFFVRKQVVNEENRMRYRYLAMRDEEFQRRLRVRSSVLHRMRQFLKSYGFVDVDTPCLFAPSPGGAKEFLVPVKKGFQYALVQSPQILKQLLMMGSLDRYFQIAKCFRDERSRSDRQPEFTQLDIEMSFTNSEFVIKLIEDLLVECWPREFGILMKPFKRITYKDAIQFYATDKPDLSVPITIEDVTSRLATRNGNFTTYIFKTNTSKEFHESIYLEQYSEITTSHNVSFIVNFEKFSKKIGALCNNDGFQFAKDSRKKLNLDKNHILVVVLGDKNNALKAIGQFRAEFGRDLIKQSILETTSTDPQCLWVTEFPLFSKEEDEITSEHHFFTAPLEDDLHLLETNPLEVRSKAYDLVINGEEIGGGSIRIHDYVLQEKIFKILKMKDHNLEFFVNAMKSGCPPHGGIALGIDRLMSVMMCTETIRDVIAFPKGNDAQCLLSGAPFPDAQNTSFITTHKKSIAK